MNNGEAKVFDLVPKIKEKRQEEAKEASADEPVAQLAAKIGQMLQDEQARPIHQLAALGVVGKAVRMAIAAYHGEEVATRAVEKAFYLSQQYEPEWAHKPKQKSWQQMIFETGKCPLCDQPIKGPKPDGSYDLKHLPECPLVPPDPDHKFVRPGAGKEEGE